MISSKEVPAAWWHSGRAQNSSLANCLPVASMVPSSVMG